MYVFTAHRGSEIQSQVIASNQSLELALALYLYNLGDEQW